MLYCPTPRDVSAEFDRLLATDADEHAMHAFMAKHTEFIPKFVQLNHGVFLSCVFNKLAVGLHETDFVYVTKSSDRVQIVLTEIEPSTKPLFTSKRRGVGMSAPLTDALDQIRSWRSAIERTSARASVIESLDGFLWYADGNEVGVDFRYQLLIGRRPSDTNQLTRLGELAGETGIKIKTYDTIRDAVERGDGERVIVLGAREGRFQVQNWDTHPSALSRDGTRDRFWFTAEDEALMSQWGYPVGRWGLPRGTVSLRDAAREQVDYAEWRCANKSSAPV